MLLQKILLLTPAQTFDCGSIGNQNANLGSTGLQRLPPGLYLNTDNPATCRGNVTRWNYCYYLSQSVSDDDDIIPRVQFAVYRRNGTGSGYVKVSDVFTALIADNDVDANFDCHVILLRRSQFVQVESGDVIGACILSTSLDVARARSGESPMSVGTCGFDLLPESVDAIEMSSMNGLLLNVYADDILQTLINQPMPPTTVIPLPEQGIIANPGGTEAETRIDLESAQGAGAINGTNQNTPSVASSFNLGIVTAIVVVIVLVVVLLIVVVIFVILVVRHFKRSKEDHIAENHAFVALSDSSRTYDVPEITMSLKLEVQDEIQKTSKDAKERGYDYANFTHRLERSEYVSMRTNPMPMSAVEPDYSLLEPLMSAGVADYSKHLEKNKREDIYGSVGIYAKPASVETELYAQLNSFNIRSIPGKDIRVTGHLGSGYFGQVQQGVWMNGDETVEVAMKTLNKQVIHDMDKVKFLQEAAIMAQFRHPNIVTLYGIIYKEEPMMLVLELVDRGNLKDYLLFLQPASFGQQMESLNKLLLKFSQQVALGMQYLSARGYIHRDLAARNVLVNKYGICKITDFGMSRDLAEENYYVANNRDAIPVKWTAPEALYYKKYSTSSDVWSYGCLLYEIWSLGHTPFGDTINREVIKIISSGKRLASPPGCPKIIYELMIQCWNPSSSDRPGFREMVLVLIASEVNVLFIPPEALETHQLAGVLGSPLEAGEAMYPELQRTYM